MDSGVHTDCICASRASGDILQLALDIRLLPITPVEAAESSVHVLDAYVITTIPVLSSPVVD